MAGIFFETYNFEKICSQDFDLKVGNSAHAGKLICIFMWGHDCPNCDVAKKALVEHQAEVEKLEMKWYHADIYEDFELARRFGLFGIPVFLFFKNGKKLGKISPFPGFEAFFEAVSRLT